MGIEWTPVHLCGAPAASEKATLSLHHLSQSGEDTLCLCFSPFPPPQVRMYQLMALLHEYLPVLHAHLEKHTVSAYLIAASWFLTMFSSQYPFAFVS